MKKGYKSNLGSINFSFIATADMRDDLSAVTSFEMRPTALENVFYGDFNENYKETSTDTIFIHI